MRAIAEHDIEQNHGRLRILRLRGDALIAQPVIDHRVRAAARENVVAKIDQRVGAALPHIVEHARATDRRVGIDVRHISPSSSVAS